MAQKWYCIPNKTVIPWKHKGRQGEVKAMMRCHEEYPPPETEPKETTKKRKRWAKIITKEYYSKIR
jgi:hypothetical protein